MKVQSERTASKRSWRACLLVTWVWLCPGLPLAGGTWVAVTNAPHNIGVMLLLSDGTVMCKAASANTTWVSLLPDEYGNYATGTWSSNIPPMYHARSDFASDVLPDGRVFVAGGEHPDKTNTANAEIYDPVTTNWTEIDPPLSLFDPSTNFFSDMISIVTTFGAVLMAPVKPSQNGGTLLYFPQTGVWSNGPTLANGANNQDECGWSLLPDGSVITVDRCSRSSQRYIPALNQWIKDGTLPVFIWNENSNGTNNGPGCEVGPILTLPNGNVFYGGGTGTNALYAPSGNTNNGQWTAGPVLPNKLQSSDCPGAMMVNGKVLFAASTNCYNGGCDTPYHYLEYDPSNGPIGSVTEVSGPPTELPGAPHMLDLPDGTVLVSGADSQTYIYQPGGPPPQAAWKPSIQSISENADGSYYLVGTGLNGVTEGAKFGDDAQMASNYPLVRMTNDASGKVYYARTYNWSSTAIQTGSSPESTDFRLPTDLPHGSYSLVVLANGIASDPVSFYGPVWVDFYYTGALQNGTFTFPYKLLASGISAVASGGIINLKPGSSTETFSDINKPMQIRSVGGTATVGH